MFQRMISVVIQAVVKAVIDVALNHIEEKKEFKKNKSYNELVEKGFIPKR